MQNCKVDVVIPVYRPDDTLRLLLLKLQEQTFAVHKVIIMNTEKAVWDAYCGQSAVRELFEKFTIEYEVHHVTKEQFDHGATRREGVSNSDADVFVCMTMDAMPGDAYLIEKLVDGLQLEKQSLADTQQAGTQIAAAYARQLPNETCKVTERYTRSFNYPDTSRVKTKTDVAELGIKTFFCSNVCAAYNRKIYDSLGGFPEQAIFNEDMIYAGHAVNAGYGICYAADARVIHSHNYSGRQQFHRNFDLAVSQKMHPEVFEGIRSESEGMKLVKQTAKYLLSIHKPWLIVDLVVKSGYKYLGYRAGKRFQSMSHRKILRHTMNRSFWERYWKQ